jgi:APA family basic amino acid/polyamine antiporter
VASILLVGAMATIIAAFFSLGSIFELVNVGALTAFMVLAIAVIILRIKEPELERSFKCPLVPIIPVMSIIFSIVLIAQLKIHILQIFAIWLAVGIIVYFVYGKYRGLFTKPVDGINEDSEGYEPPLETPASK